VSNTRARAVVTIPLLAYQGAWSNSVHYLIARLSGSRTGTRSHRRTHTPTGPELDGCLKSLRKGGTLLVYPARFHDAGLFVSVNSPRKESFINVFDWAQLL
jgi:hypothetical protein